MLLRFLHNIFNLFARFLSDFFQMHKEEVWFASNDKDTTSFYIDDSNGAYICYYVMQTLRQGLHFLYQFFELSMSYFF